MYINPFLAGILFTIGVELLIIVAIAVAGVISDKISKRRK